MHQGLVLPPKVFTDGSAIHPTDPWMRRAAWAVARCTADGVWHEHASPTAGAQTVPRSELAAALWAARHAGEELEVVSDSTYVVDGCKKLKAGLTGQLFAGPDGDLWKQLFEVGVPTLTGCLPTKRRRWRVLEVSCTRTGLAMEKLTRLPRTGPSSGSPPRPSWRGIIGGSLSSPGACR